MMQKSVCMKIQNTLILLFLLAILPLTLSAQSGPAIQLPAGWYPNFPIANWLESRSNVIQTLNTQSITSTRNVADELIWNSIVTTYPTETDLLFNQSNELKRISVYVHEQTNASARHAQWFGLFMAQYGTDYTEENNSDIHLYKWPNENGVSVELILYRQNPNFAIRAEFLKQ